jgi:NAD+ diphosphatase
MSVSNPTFVPGVVRPDNVPAGPAWWLPVRGGDIGVCRVADGSSSVLFLETPGEIHFRSEVYHYLGLLEDAPVYAVQVDADEELGDEIQLHNLRAIHGLLGEQLFTLAGRAFQIVEWDRQHRFCGRCGTSTTYVPGERAKRCPNCGLMSFPRLSPAVIVLVERGDDVLLARHTRTTDGMYALLAGFVEPGESLEDAVQREIREECGIEVDRITYFGSQPWPFPNSLMLGFTAQYAGGAIVVDGIEIADAQWFTTAAMPKVPPRLSIARKLIDAYAAKHGVTILQP